MFQHTAARRRLDVSTASIFANTLFQHTAARRRLVRQKYSQAAQILFQHTAARRRLEISLLIIKPSHCFNTQPPEGGWSQPCEYS